MPADASLAERMVLVVLAHHADEQSRECWPGMEVLARRTGLHPDSVRRSLTRLEGRGIALRVGSAAKGHRTVYRIPPMQSQDGTSYQSNQRQDGTSALSAVQSQDGSSGLSIQRQDAASPKV